MCVNKKIALIKKIEEFQPYNEQESEDRIQMLKVLKTQNQVLLRENKMVHFTASAWVLNPEKTKLLMVYHNIYNSWSWTGGHADGEADLMYVARKECCEETGIQSLKDLSNDIFSLEILTVDGHEKHGRYVNSHLHLNVTYLFEADEEQNLKYKLDENSGVAWIPVTEIRNKVSEPWMMARIYEKLLDKCREL